MSLYHLDIPLVMYVDNDDFTLEIAEKVRRAIQGAPENYIINESPDNNEEYVNFFFLGRFEGREAVYDAALYTLRLYHESELYEIAEHRAAQRFPEFSKIKYEEDENGDMAELNDSEEEIGLFMTEVMIELEEEEAVKVREHVEIDSNLDHRVGLDAGMNVPEITADVIKKFVAEFNNDEIELDDTLYSFQLEEDEALGK